MTTNDKDISVQGSVLDKYVQQPAEADESQPIITECYTEMPTHVAMLDLVDEAGNHTALPYHALEEAKFNPSEGISLKFHGQQVKIVGRTLSPLYVGLLRHCVTRIQSIPRDKFLNFEHVSIERIKIDKK
ncbi:MAG: hypothetical protein AAGC72_00470 [Planctomycetota bacterium]